MSDLGLGTDMGKLEVPDDTNGTQPTAGNLSALLDSLPAYIWDDDEVNRLYLFISRDVKGEWNISYETDGRHYYPNTAKTLIEATQALRKQVQRTEHNSSDPDAKPDPSNPPSTRPMTLRQQLDKWYADLPTLVLPPNPGEEIVWEVLPKDVEALCQEIAIEAVDTALKTERKAVLGFSNDMKIDRALALAEKSGYEKCEAYYKRTAELRERLELTQKPQQEGHHD